MEAPAGFLVAPIMTFASGVPMDILMPDGQSRVPAFQRNAGGRLFKTGAELNRAADRPERRGRRRRRSRCRSSATTCGSVTASRRSTCACRGRSRWGRVRVEPIVEVFNLFNVTNILGVSVKNYSGYANVLVRDSAESGRSRATCGRRASVRR